MKRRKTVAFLTGGIMDLFSVMIARGIMSAIDEDDVNLLIVPLKYINRQRTENVDPSEYQYQTNALFLKKENVDVLIAAADSFGCLTTRENVLRFMESLDDIPTVLVASKIDGYAGVTFDNQAGLEAGLDYQFKIFLFNMLIAVFSGGGAFKQHFYGFIHVDYFLSYKINTIHL